MRIRLTLLAILAASQAAAASLGSGGPVDISADKLDVQHLAGTAVFSGNVVVKQGGLTLTAPSLTAAYTAGGKGGDLDSLTATGGVTITRAAGLGGATEETATGTTATYTPASQRLVLTGVVTLTRGPSTLSGDKLVYNLATGNAQVTNSTGPVKARFVAPAGAVQQ